MENKRNNIKSVIITLVALELVIWLLILLFAYSIIPSIEGLVIQRPSYIWANLGLTFFTIILILLVQIKSKKLLSFSDSNLFNKISPDRSKILNTTKYIIIRLALLLLILAIMNPRYGNKKVEAKTTGIDIIIALDVSNSMLAEDIQPSRLGRAKMAIGQLLNNLHGDRIGIVVFAGEAYVQLPITTDIGAAKLFLDEIDNNIIPTQGTAIGKAIDLASNSFKKDSKKGKVIIVVTDGENHEDDAIEAAKAAKETGVIVYTIGMGSENGAPIPEYRNGRKLGYKKDSEGNTIVSKLNEDALRQIANAGDGKFTRATITDVGLDLILEDIEKLDKNDFGSTEYADYEDRFQIFLFLAIVLLILEAIIPRRKLKWTKKLNLFNEKT